MSITEDEGKHEEIRIELPKGSYAPVFRTAGGNGERADAPGKPRMRGLLYGAVIVAAAATVALALFGRHLTRSTSANALPPSANFIAVLPFQNLTGVTDDERLTDTFTEELTNRLARFSELRVAARRSAFQFKGKPYDVRRIGEQLRVGNVLEGSVWQEGDQLEVNVEMVSTRDGFNLWSDRFASSVRGYTASRTKS